MSRAALSRPEDCNCLAVRQAARHITQFYDQFLAASGLRTTQFSILGKLRRLGPMTINALAAIWSWTAPPSDGISCRWSVTV